MVRALVNGAEFGSVSAETPRSPGIDLRQGTDCSDIYNPQAILGTKVDLVPASDLKPAVRARAEHDLVPL
jgi:hypothetical protein